MKNKYPFSAVAASSAATPTTVPLPPSFEKNGFQFEVLERTGQIALLRKTHRKYRNDVSFELVVVRIHPAEIVRSRVYPAREALPHSEAWGRFGWSYRFLADAKKKFAELVLIEDFDSAPAGTRSESFSTAESCLNRGPLAPNAPRAQGLLRLA